MTDLNRIQATYGVLAQRLALDALARLALDESESPERRERASSAIDRHLVALPSSYGPPPWAQSHGHVNRGHSGGDSLRTDAEYDGRGSA